MKLTRDQAAVIGAYTGYAAGPFADIHAYAERVLGRPIFTREFANPGTMDALRAAAKADFVALCATREPTK